MVDDVAGERLLRFLVERYVPSRDLASLAADVDRLAALGAAGVRHVLSIAMPADETCLMLIEAGSLAAVLDAYRRAGIEVDRVARAELLLEPGASFRYHGGTRSG
jgi:hypothetical protein